MSLYNPEVFRRRRAAGFDGLFDWDYFLPIFDGTNIEPMDLDMFIERRGRFYVMETKAPGVEVPTGQRIALETLSRHPAFTVVQATGKQADAITDWAIWKGSGRQPARGSTALYDHLRNWFISASNRQVLETDAQIWQKRFVESERRQTHQAMHIKRLETALRLGGMDAERVAALAVDPYELRTPY